MEKIYESEFLKLNTPEKFGALKKIVSGDAELIQDINSKDIKYIKDDIKTVTQYLDFDPITDQYYLKATSLQINGKDIDNSNHIPMID